MDPAHARVPISHDFVGIQFECPGQRIDREWSIVLRFCDLANRRDLPASEFDLLKKVFEWCYRGTLEHKIGQGVARGFRVVVRELRPFRATLSHVKSNGRIRCQFHHVLWSPARILSSRMADSAELDLISNCFMTRFLSSAA
jgi:hypothetical protein